jgi:hypothetical protein
MVAGAGYAAGKSRAKSNEREADQEQRIEQLEAQGSAAPAPPPASPAPPPAAGSDRVDQLVKLKELLDSGVLSQAEFDSEKARILAS